MDFGSELLENETFDFADGLLVDDESKENADDDEVFFGPAGFREHCRSKWATGIQEGADFDRMAAQLRAEDWCEIFVNANIVASTLTASGKKKKQDGQCPAQKDLKLNFATEEVISKCETQESKPKSLEDELIVQEQHCPESDIKLNCPDLDFKVECPESDLKPNCTELDFKMNSPESDIKLNCPESDIKLNCPESDFRLECPDLDFKVECPASDLKLNEPVSPGEAFRRSTFTLQESKLLLTPETRPAVERISGVSDTSSYHTAQSSFSSPTSDRLSIESVSLRDEAKTPINRLSFDLPRTPPTVTKATPRRTLPVLSRAPRRRSLSCEEPRVPAPDVSRVAANVPRPTLRPALSDASLSGPKKTGSRLKPPLALAKECRLPRPQIAAAKLQSGPPSRLGVSRLVAPSIRPSKIALPPQFLPSGSKLFK